MITDWCKPINEGESPTVRVVMSIHEARAFTSADDPDILISFVSGVANAARRQESQQPGASDNEHPFKPGEKAAATIREQAETIERLTRERDEARSEVDLWREEWRKASGMLDASRADAVKLAERVRGLREAWTDLLHEVERGESWDAKGGAAKAAMVPLLSNLRPSIRSYLKSAVRAALANGEG